MASHQKILGYLEDNGMNSLLSYNGINGLLKDCPELGEIVTQFKFLNTRQENFANIFSAVAADNDNRSDATLELLDKLSGYIFKGIDDDHMRKFEAGRQCDFRMLYMTNAVRDQKYLLPNTDYYPLVEKITDDVMKLYKTNNEFAFNLASTLAASVMTYNILMMQQHGIGNHFPFKPKTIAEFQSHMCTMSGDTCDGLVNAFTTAATPYEFVEKAIVEFREDNVFPVRHEDYSAYVSFTLLLHKQGFANEADEISSPLSDSLRQAAGFKGKDKDFCSEVGGFYGLLKKIQDALVNGPYYHGNGLDVLREIAVAEQQTCTDIAIAKEFGMKL